MIRAILFFITVAFFGTAFAQQACFDLFKIQGLTALKQQNTAFDPADLAEAGLLIAAGSHDGLQAVRNLITRDGTYPLLIDSNFNIIIDHRLPNPYGGLNAPFLATHRGLYARLHRLLGHRPEIIFAGQIRVVGGRAANLIDQAGSFFQGIEDFSIFGDQAMAHLIESNQRRLDFAAGYFRLLGIIDVDTPLINFRKQFQTYGASLLNEGHRTAREAAAFERSCRYSRACIDKYIVASRYVRYVVQQGGAKWVTDNFNTITKKTDMGHAYQFVSYLNQMLQEGVFDVMASADILDAPSAEPALQLNQYLKDLPYFFGPMP